MFQKVFQRLFICFFLRRYDFVLCCNTLVSQNPHTKSQISDPAPNTIDDAMVMRGHVKIRLINSDVILSATCQWQINKMIAKRGLFYWKHIGPGLYFFRGDLKILEFTEPSIKLFLLLFANQNVIRNPANTIRYLDVFLRYGRQMDVKITLCAHWVGA